MEIYGYYHIYAIKNYLQIVEDQLKSLQKSGLLEKTDIINISIGYEPP